MARAKVKVARGASDTLRLPELVNEGASLLVKLGAEGVLTNIGERLKIRRQGGYCALDIFIILLVFFASGPGLGIRGFWEKIRRHARQLAALAGRRGLATPASLSRALSSLEFELVRPASGYLLCEATGIDVLLKYSATLTVDVCCGGWQVFDRSTSAGTDGDDATSTGVTEGGGPSRTCDFIQTYGGPGHSGRKH